jgi:hypothetical protein
LPWFFLQKVNGIGRDAGVHRWHLGCSHRPRREIRGVFLSFLGVLHEFDEFIGGGTQNLFVSYNDS